MTRRESEFENFDNVIREAFVSALRTATSKRKLDSGEGELRNAAKKRKSKASALDRASRETD